MDYRACLLNDRSKADIQRRADPTGSDTGRFGKGMEVVLCGTSREARITSWSKSITWNTPELDGLWGGKDARHLGTPLHQRLHRNMIRAMQFCSLPKAMHGQIINTMCVILQDPVQPIALRAFAITIGMRMEKFYPELAVECNMTHGGVAPRGLRSRSMLPAPRKPIVNWCVKCISVHRNADVQNRQNPISHELK